MKKILLFVIVLIGIIIPNHVYAIQDSFNDYRYINVYVVKRRGSSGRYEQMKMFKRLSDNMPVYCIQIWEGLNSYKQLEGYDSNQYIHANIDYSTWERIMLIAYYGYGYSYHTTDEWYGVTQFMIWQATAPDTTIFFTNSLNGERNDDKFKSEIDEINNLIKNHGKKPSFSNQTYQLKYKEQLTITDCNNVLDNYSIIKDNGLNVSKSGNKITVTSSSIGNHQLSLVHNDTRYFNNPIVYIDDSGQNMLAAGRYNSINAVVNLNLSAGNITINNLDFDTKSNVSQGSANLKSTFQLLDKDKSVVATGKTDSSGKLIFNNIGYGDYSIREVETGSGYLLNTDLVKVSVSSGNSSINIYNKVIKNKIIFNKYLRNSITNTLKNDKNAKFNILDENNNLIEEFSTNEDGYYELELPYGKYTVKQLEGTKNYKLVDDFSIDVSINNKEQVFDLYSDELVIPVRIRNLDSDSLLPILEEGATFIVTNSDNDITLTTNSLGFTDIIYLSSGVYEIKQISPVSNYILNDKVVFLDINEDNYSYDNEEVVVIDYENSKEKTKIEVTKEIEYYLNDELINRLITNDINIDIYAYNDIYSKDGIRIYKKDDIVCSINSNGECTLEFGNYYINDDINSKIIDITLDSSNTRHINLLDKVYEYSMKRIIDVPNTYDNSFTWTYVYLLLVYLGFILLYRGDNYEDK